ncbi:MAG: D-alanine--D-alanine ligase [Francisellaceae bacterium]
MQRQRWKQAKIAVIYGGASAERDVSLKSGAAVIESLKRNDIDVIAIDAVGAELVDKLRAIKPDCALIMLHGGDGEDGHVQSLLQLLEIPHTGSSFTGCALSMDKMLSKERWLAHGIRTPGAVYLDEKLDIKDLSYPLAIKPVHEGSSIGVSRVDRKEDLADAYALAAVFGEVMAEEWIEGREISVSILHDKALPSIWIEPARQFYDYSAKYTPGTHYHCPSGLNQEQEHEIARLAERAFKVLHCRGWGRVDFILSEKNHAFYALEVNTVPGMTALSLVPQAAKAMGILYDDLVMAILNTAK